VSRRKIVVVGSANADLVIDVEHRPTGGETLLGSDLVTSPGGKGANQAVAAGLLGGDVSFVGCVGRDDSGRLLRRSLARAGVDVTQLREVDAPTGTALIFLPPDGENSIVVSPGANRLLNADVADELAVEWSETAVLVVQLEIPLETVDRVVADASGAGVRVVLNAAPAAPLTAQTLAAADPLVVNEAEAAFLLGVDPVPEPTISQDLATATALLGRGPRSVVVTLGARGAVVAQNGDDAAPRSVHVPAPRVAAVDTTGAGDAFVGALAVALADGLDLESAIQRSTLVAAHAVTRRGAQDSYPTAAEVVA